MSISNMLMEDFKNHIQTTGVSKVYVFLGSTVLINIHMSRHRSTAWI